MTSEVFLLKEIEIKCEKCGTELQFSDLIVAWGFFGILFLVGENDGYFGFTCPKCFKTILKRDDRNNIESIKNTINQPGCGFPDSDEILRYHSVPSSFDEYEDEGSMQGRICQTAFPFHHSKRMEPYELSNLNDYETDRSEGYITYFLGDLAMGPAMIVIWFKKEAIEDLLKTENQTGLRIFPRYRFYDPVFENIDDFCWEHHTKLENFTWLRGFPGVEVTIEELFAAERKFDKASDFLRILKMQLYQQSPSLPSSLIHLLNANQIPINQPVISPRQNHKIIIDGIWENFLSERVQEGLSILSKRFIYEYLELAKKTKCSPESIWDLKEKYLLQLHDYIGSPSGKKRIIIKVPKAELENVRKAEQAFSGVKIISQDPTINDIKIKIPRLSRLEDHKIDFLLIGETGTGKDLFAKAIHESSNRRGKYIPVNCGAIPEDLFESELFGYKKGAFTGAEKDKKGFFEQANEGTIFLDEIGELDMRFQPKLLRVIQEKEIQPLGVGEPEKIDVRMVFATNRNLDEMVKTGEFRDDLLHRISKFRFDIPPLRERKMDIPILVEHFIHKHDTDRLKLPKLEPYQITPECMDFLKNQQWKGNVRELENVISRIIIMKAVEHDRTAITIDDLSQSFPDRINIPSKPSQKKQKLPGNMKITDDQVKELMKQFNNKSEVAKELGVTYKTIQRRCKKLDI